MKARPIAPTGAYSTAARAVSRSVKNCAAQAAMWRSKKRSLHTERGRGAEAALDQAGHHLAQRRDVVLGLLDLGGARHAELGHVAAQPRERLLVQEPGQIIGGIGNQLAAADADEQLEILVRHPGRGRLRRFGSERPDALAEGGFITLQPGRDVEQGLVGWRREQTREQTIDPRPQLILGVNDRRHAHTGWRRCSASLHAPDCLLLPTLQLGLL